MGIVLLCVGLFCDKCFVQLDGELLDDQMK